MEEHPPYCRKESDISTLKADVKILKSIVMGNGQEGLNTMVPKLNENIKSLTDNIRDLGTGVSGLTRYVDTLEGKHSGKQELKKRNQWIIGTLIAVSGLLIAGMSILIDTILNHLK